MAKYAELPLVEIGKTVKFQNSLMKARYNYDLTVSLDLPKIVFKIRINRHEKILFFFLNYDY